jgi:hypothetical protein
MHRPLAPLAPPGVGDGVRLVGVGVGVGDPAGVGGAVDVGVGVAKAQTLLVKSACPITASATVSPGADVARPRVEHGYCQ